MTWEDAGTSDTPVVEVDRVSLMREHTPPSCDFINMETCSWELIAFLVAKVGRGRVWTDG